MRRALPCQPVAFFLLALTSAPAGLAAQSRFTLEDVLSYRFPYELVSAAGADRIAWIEIERGMRNVYTAAAPDFVPAALTRNVDDDGQDLTGLQISADGSVVAFLRGHTPNREGWIANPSSDPRGSERAVWAASTAGGRAWRVVEARDFELSPDGRWVAWAKDGQIHRTAVNPGASARTDDAEPLFRAFGVNGSPAWSPDGRRIAFLSDRGDHAFVGVYDTDRPGITYLAPGVDRDASPTWSPDGKRIAFLRRPGQPFGSRVERPRTVADSAFAPGLLDSRFPGGHRLSLWIAEAETGEGRELWHPAAGDSLMEQVRQIHWVNDRILFEAEPANWQHWFSLAADAENPEPVELTPGTGFVEQVAFAKDGRTLYYASNIGDLDRRHVWRVPVAGGRATQLTRGEGSETYPAALASGARVALLQAGPGRPQSVALVPAAGGSTRILTALPAEFPQASHVMPQNVTITAEDGLEFHNQLFLPADLRPGEKRPALIFIHGGSRRQMLLGYHYMFFYHMAYAVNQYFASRGWIVLSVNYRSGIGYGREFRNAPEVGARGNAEYRDIIAAGRYLQGRPDVDPARVGLWGLSYGGILTAQGLARNSDVFAAGVDIAGIHLWGNSIDPESVSFRASSISEIGKWTSPVLLVHADDDRNVAFSQTVGLVQLLRAHGVPHELIVFPDDVHDFLLHGRWLETFRAAEDFFDRTIIRKQPVRAESPGRTR